MGEDNQIHPFLKKPSNPDANRYQTQRPGGPKPIAAPPLPPPISQPFHYRSARRSSSKCLVYTLLLIVFLGALLLAFGAVVLRLKPLEVTLRSVTVRRLRQTAAPPFWEADLAARVAIRNRNYGPFEWRGGGGGTVVYGGRTVGEMSVGKGRAAARGTAEVSAAAKVSSRRLGKGYDGRENDGGRLKMEVRVRVTGKVRFVKVLQRKKVAELNCNMTLDFAAKKIQDFLCG